MLPEITAALASLKTIAELSVLAVKTSTDSRVTEKAIELQSALISLQGAMLSLQSQYQDLLQEKDELEKRLADKEKWDADTQNYTLTEIGRKVFAYALKPDRATSAPAHWLCANCYENKKKSVLQRLSGSLYRCHSCKSDLIVRGARLG